MGWTSYHAEHYKNGQVDRKAECDAYFEEDLNRGHYKVLKSAMKGSTYYAAVQPQKKYVGEDEKGNGIYEDLEEKEKRVFGVVFLTSVNQKDYYNFSYKDMDETMNPFAYDCPKSILKLLSPTDNEFALLWRKKCEERQEHLKRLKNLKEGTRIRFKSPSDTSSGIKAGEEVELMKRIFWGKTMWMLNVYTYWNEKQIPVGFEVVENSDNAEQHADL